ncbi:hypothetical protein E3N88_08435 [Mikania micrantha]|uniref:Uncharacterized protein n=1 Tax=Mikania micrantha TaxID=192012 RepID=A0A5N6PG79_9ASTR|nr:hypothetical protein E3N88_08435 [Mikania micrantha]
MKNSTMDIHVRDIKAKIARGELLSIEQIQAQRASLMRGLGLGGGATIEIPISGSGIRYVIKIKKGKKPAKKQQSTNPDPERQSKADERRKEPSTTEDAGSQPTATTGATVGSNVENEQATDQRSQATAQERPRFRRRKSIARRKKRTTAISSDSEPDSPPL